MLKRYRTIGVPHPGPGWNEVDAETKEEALKLLQEKASGEVRMIRVQVLENGAWTYAV